MWFNRFMTCAFKTIALIGKYQSPEVAKRFADTLQGALVDDNRQPLSDSQLDHIRREFIGKPQATMASFGLAAGSPQALRLFS